MFGMYTSHPLSTSKLPGTLAAFAILSHALHPHTINPLPLFCTEIEQPYTCKLLFKESKSTV